MKQQHETLTCYPDTRIYIFCPAGFATGGPEALHQLGAHLTNLGFNAFMYYYSTPDSVDIIHKNYEKYAVPHVDVLENEEHHIMIMPETHISPIFEDAFKHIRKVVWWLSVVNYHITQKNLINEVKHKRLFGLRLYWGHFNIATFRRLKQMGIINISHSYYSQVHLLEHGIKPIARISDYMNSAFFNMVDENTAKENLVIYNPKKNDAFLDEIIARTPGLNWVPIKDMTPAQVAQLMNRAKLYVDFGYHPGKERMPREACIMRCCMIIGKSGSAAYTEDMPIPDKYRFAKSTDQIDNIVKQVQNCIENYDELIADFASYRQDLYHEEKEFTDTIKKVFVKAQSV